MLTLPRGPWETKHPLFMLFYLCFSGWLFHWSKPTNTRRQRESITAILVSVSWVQRKGKKRRGHCSKEHKTSALPAFFKKIHFILIVLQMKPESFVGSGGPECVKSWMLNCVHSWHEHRIVKDAKASEPWETGKPATHMGQAQEKWQSCPQELRMSVHERLISVCKD